MNVFEIKYWKIGKSTGAIKQGISGLATYEEVLFRYMLNKVSNSIYHMDYWYAMLGEHVFVERKSANSKICVYEVALNDLYKRDLELFKYKVEIECVYDSKEGDICEEEEDLNYRTPESKDKKESKQFTKWVMNESRAIRWFLWQLDQVKSLELLKEETSKATYYRNLKACKAKGYIKDGQLVRKVWV